MKPIKLIFCQLQEKEWSSGPQDIVVLYDYKP